MTREEAIEQLRIMASVYGTEALGGDLSTADDLLVESLCALGRSILRDPTIDRECDARHRRPRR